MNITYENYDSFLKVTLSACPTKLIFKKII